MGATTSDLEKQFAIKFKDDWIDQVEQKKSVLETTVRTDPDFLEGKFGYYDRMGSTASQKQTTRGGDTQYSDVPGDRRRIIRSTYDWAKLLNRRDLRRLMKNPQNIYLKKSAAARNRDLDDEIIAAFDGDAYSVDENDVAGAITFPVTNDIAVNFKIGGGGANSGLTRDKITKSFELLSTDEIDMDESEDLFFVVGPKQWTDLLLIPEVISSDYVAGRPVQNPNSINFMGFNWRRSNRLGVDANGYRKCFAYHREAIGAAFDMDPFTDIGPNRAKKVQTQIYQEWEIGVTRIEDERIKRVFCLET